jgi:hypothetical protein
MSEQQSKKRGKRSDAEKQARAREGYEPLPPSQPVAGTFGEQQGADQTDQDWVLRVEEKTRGGEQAAEPD